MVGSPRMNSRKRLRASHACDSCRLRKIRCDGRTPCGSCQAAAQSCLYGAEATSRGKSDLILEEVEQIKVLLNTLNAKIDSGSSALAILSPHGSTPSAGLNGPWSHISPSDDTTQNIDNAVLRLHTSTAESILHWPYLASFSSLRDEYTPVFQLEQSRQPFRHKMRISYPRLAKEDVTTVANAFSHAVNFVFPIMSVDRLERCTSSIVDASVMQDDNTDACLSLLVIALGCASQTVSHLLESEFTVEDKRWCASRRALGDHFFDLAMTRLPSAHTDTTGTAAHCLFFVGLYFCYLRRPLQAWEYIKAASAKCLLLLMYPHPASSEEGIEHLRRIFWACYIVESDYIAELPALPCSGIARVESQVPLPGDYSTHGISSEQEQSSLYFLACISMRRLLNRVHQLLYDNETGVGSHSGRFPLVVAELDQQLSTWREVLPASVSFTLDNSSVHNSNITEAASFLRLRYLGCRSVIYRPYLSLVLSGEGVDPATGEVNYAVWEGSKNCIDALSLLVQSLDGFPHQVLIDTWQSSLSFACSMLILLAAANNSNLRPLIGDGVLTAGRRLVSLYQKWESATGGPNSPTVEQSVRLMGHVDMYINQLDILSEGHYT